MTIGDRIKKRRKEIGLSVDELALKLKKNRATIYRYENEAIENLPVTILEPLAIALHTTPSYLMGWEQEEKNNIVNVCLLDEIKNKYGILVAEIVEKTKDLSPIQQAKVIGYLDNIKNTEFRSDSSNKVS